VTQHKEMTRRQFLSMALPAGRVEMQSVSCTGCGLCAAVCPTHALYIQNEADKLTLFFAQKKCIGCAECITGCPEKCLTLNKELDADKIGSSPALLFEDELILCGECGKPVAPRVMIDKLKLKIGSGAHLEFCPDCRLAMVRS
jgi:ferredoxin